MLITPPLARWRPRGCRVVAVIEGHIDAGRAIRHPSNQQHLKPVAAVLTTESHRRSVHAPSHYGRLMSCSRGEVVGINQQRLLNFRGASRSAHPPPGLDGMAIVPFAAGDQCRCCSSSRRMDRELQHHGSWLAGATSRLTPRPGRSTGAGSAGGMASISPAVQQGDPVDHREAQAGAGLGHAWSKMDRGSGRAPLRLMPMPVSPTTITMPVVDLPRCAQTPRKACRRSASHPRH